MNLNTIPLSWWARQIKLQRVQLWNSISLVGSSPSLFVLFLLMSHFANFTSSQSYLAILPTSLCQIAKSTCCNEAEVVTIHKTIEANLANNKK
jgi:hypothetical protein